MECIKQWPLAESRVEYTLDLARRVLGLLVLVVCPEESEVTATVSSRTVLVPVWCPWVCVSVCLWLTLTHPPANSLHAHSRPFESFYPARPVSNPIVWSPLSCIAPPAAALSVTAQKGKKH